ncbi:MAG: flagellar biosynthesis anti-sigma factor FlgM [Clostridium sp.]|jgi:negative regulator of flagellin synthesis FlgM|uniref:flagellar biosynthesis anti-sigma factor FlgM n=1 Tax=Clostridium sp. TaxID=1506 RepID=UPI0025B80F89|nr:flagellar biosynthesis anti-sigma factor FlgM [Clostridium sp.]MCH3964335.1 flagellar biosynthesis anti-sigma factor FlgM [Clostridium sp.]MCI1715510.1 flagellar biosynthesis anti-sigma factor FlgM [Clostridium sp.]MCI1799698.1 flagellar biosynthesis anti-sigma factor FlgM [Clostridium sp.]MCI1813694.1 flagellar biosynthesis anti-sigma factor FlgM [Clostridium sp.]MCI1870511.1 flagellar biosynthesis anti-sigma factor FlgM [Clostridium sp.]
MKVNGIGSNQMVNPYSENRRGKDINHEVRGRDSISISSVGKSLSSYSMDGSMIDSKEKVENIKKAVSNGTYNVDARLVAQKIIDAMKGRI